MDKIHSLDIEWYGRLFRIILRGPKTFSAGRTGLWFYAHFYILGFAFRRKLP